MDLESGEGAWLKTGKPLVRGNWTVHESGEGWVGDPSVRVGKTGGAVVQVFASDGNSPIGMLDLLLAQIGRLAHTGCGRKPGGRVYLTVEGHIGSPSLPAARRGNRRVTHRSMRNSFLPSGINKQVRAGRGTLSRGELIMGFR